MLRNRFFFPNILQIFFFLILYINYHSMLLNFERYFFPDKPDLYVIAFTTRLPKIKKKSLKHLRNEKSLRLIIMILTLYV